MFEFLIELCNGASILNYIQLKSKLYLGMGLFISSHQTEVDLDSISVTIMSTWRELS